MFKKLGSDLFAGKAGTVAPADDGALGRTIAASGETNDLLIGTEVGGYVLEALLGYGGFATVYRGREVAPAAGAEPGRVAVKVLHAHLSLVPDAAVRFRREVEALGAIGHPNIVSLIATGDIAPGRPYVILEYLEGRTLEEEIMVRGALSVAEAVAVFEQLGGAVGAAHRHGIVHRDIKASNVLVVPGPAGLVVKLLDFGIVKVLDARAAEHLTATGMVVGTPWNMAPEQIIGRAVDTRTDIYALGVLLYHLVTGRLPFDGKSAIEVCNLHLTAPPPRAADVAPVPGPVDMVIRRCLAKQPDDRFQTVEDLVETLREARMGLGEQSTSTPVRAIALRMEWRVAESVADDDLDDEVMDDVETVADICRAACTRARLDVASDSGNLLLGLHVLPEDARAADALGDELIEVAIDIRRQLAERDAASPLVEATVSALLGLILVRHQDGRRIYVGAEHMVGTPLSLDGVPSPAEREQAGLMPTSATISHRRPGKGAGDDEGQA